MNIKPGDVLFGIVEFLAFLVPGMALYITLPYFQFITIPEDIHVKLNTDTKPINLILFIALSYILGHFIHYIGALTLNPIYRHTLHKSKMKKHGYFIDKTEKEIRQLIPEHAKAERIADAFIRSKQPSLVSELDKHDANSKLFRATCLLCLYLCFLPGATFTHIVILIILSILSFSRFANQRWRRQLLTYEFFSVLALTNTSKEIIK